MRLPFSFIGYILEPIFLWLLRDRYVITESESTKQDMLRYGFTADRISVIPVCITSQPMKNLDEVVKFPQPTLLSLGTIRAMKRTLDQISAFEIAKKHIPNLRLKIAGSVSDSYGKKVLRRIATCAHSQDIEYLGRVNDSTKTELMQKSHLILVTSVKEGWGLIVTEANGQGTPAVVYDVDGLRDSVKNRETGLISKKNTPKELAEKIVEAMHSADDYARLRRNAWLYSQSLTLEECYQEFSQGARLS
jgi:glycosyltransferase involved in cell wall biosynthesis